MDFTDFQNHKIKPESTVIFNQDLEQQARDIRIVKLKIDDNTNPFKNVFSKNMTSN
jgi:hypothetical protein